MLQAELLGVAFSFASRAFLGLLFLFCSVRLFQYAPICPTGFDDTQINNLLIVAFVVVDIAFPNRRISYRFFECFKEFIE